jgi:hypothetical protein
MDRKMARVLFVSGLLLGAPSMALAQRWGHGPFPREGVCFFREPDFRGEYFCAEPGDNVAAVPQDMNDRISSIKTFGPAEVIVFNNVRFGGDSTRFRGDIENLRDQGWNDRISSIRVRNANEYSHGRPYYNNDRGEQGRPYYNNDRGEQGRPYYNNDRGGRSQYGTRDADRIVQRAYQDVLHRDPDPGGLSQYRSRILDDGWTEEQVRDSLRSSPEYREAATMTPAKAQDIVRRAYLSVLRREPDAGSRGYVDRVMREHWSQDDVERELRNSAEFRNRGR